MKAAGYLQAQMERRRDTELDPVLWEAPRKGA